MSNKFTIKDSGKRQDFDSGMVRDTSDDKIGWHKVLEGPLLKRWAEHLTEGAKKYPDLPDGTANWTLAKGEKEFVRFRQSLARHFIQFMNGDVDEDHAAAIVFNINGMLYTQMRMENKTRPSDEKAWAWAAGLFEGEGCIYIHKDKRGYRRPELKLAMTDADTILKFQSIVGVGNTHEYKQKIQNRKKLYVWHCGDIIEIKHALEQFKPYLSFRRLQKCNEALELAATKTKTKGKV